MRIFLNVLEDTLSRLNLTDQCLSMRGRSQFSSLGKPLGVPGAKRMFYKEQIVVTRTVP
ncbi:MAG: hypothetical protein HC781_09840 [Leptolyngbyaceae cyanobacterium CSU_1_4]|nr:hypothetical protein [Leptolyngbyaceae cyanobacterium CSU_1_4]